MGLCFVSSGMSLNSKCSLLVSFICHSHFLCAWLYSSWGTRLKAFRMFRVRYMTGRLNRTRGELLCLSSAKFRLLVGFHREISSNFRFVTKIRRNSALCSSEISLTKPRNVARNFARTFIESSREQRTKFAHFACITFAQYCISFKFEFQQKTIIFS